MKAKSMFQLLAPIAITIIWYLAELIIGGVFFSICIFLYNGDYDGTWEMLAKLPFDFEYNSAGAIFFYIVDLILIIIAEIIISIIPNKEFDNLLE